MSSYLDYNSPEQNVRYYPNGQNYYVLNPLSREFFGNLLKFEEKINSRSYNLETLNEIISIYAKCVEHYDSVKDPIKYYFLEKIQMALVNKSSLNLMASKENVKKPIKRKAYKKKDYKDIECLSETDEDKIADEIKKEPIIEEFSYDLNQKKAERSKKLSLYLQLQDKHEKELEVLPILLKGHEDKSLQNDNIINNNLRNQTDLIKKKLEKRKKMNFLRQSLDPRTFSTSFFTNTSFLEPIDSSPILAKYTRELNESLILTEFNENLLGSEGLKAKKHMVSYSCEINAEELNEIIKKPINIVIN